MSRYEVLLFFHIAGAIAWLGIGLTGHVLLVWADRHREWDFAAKLQSAFAAIEIPAAVLGPVLLAGTGVGLVADGPWRFSDLWLVTGIASFLGALAFGVIFQGPGLRRYQKVVAERGPTAPQAIALGRRLNAWMWPELALLVIALLAMIAKPSPSASVEFWVAGGLLAAVAIALTVRDLRTTDATGAAGSSGEPPPKP